MTFATPLFLLAALAAAIPIVLHLVNRRKIKEVPFSTLRFLKISVEKTRRRKQIDDFLLLVFRTAALLLIAIGLARPAITTVGFLRGGTASAVVIILDNSASMGTLDAERIRLDTAIAAATSILDELAEGDQAAVIITCGPRIAEAECLDRTQDSARQALAKCRISYERADLPGAIDKAEKLLGESDATNKQIYVISDMQKTSWLENTKPLATNPDRQDEEKSEAITSKAEDDKDETKHLASARYPVILVDCFKSPKPDVAIQDLKLEILAPLSGVSQKLSVSLLNTSSVALRPRIELFIDDKLQASSPELNIPAKGHITYDFRFALKTSGIHRGEVRLVGEDGCQQNNRRFFAIPLDQRVSIAIVRSQQHEIASLDDTYYIDRALSSNGDDNWPIQTNVIFADALTTDPLEQYKVIFCVNLPALDNTAAGRLQTYIQNGGNLVWICGDNVDAEAYNRMNAQVGGQLLPSPLSEVRLPKREDNREAWHIGFLDKTFPAFRLLVDPPSLYESVLIYKHVGVLTDTQNNVDVLARLDNGAPLLTMRSVGHGRVLFYGSSMHTSWSNLPLRPIFLPFLTRLTLELSGVKDSTREQLAGRPLLAELPDTRRPISVEIVPPGGESLQMQHEDEKDQFFRYTNTHETGIYQLRIQGKQAKHYVYSINMDPDEADATRISREELQKHLAGHPLIFVEDPNDLSRTFAMLHEGKSLWSTFLMIVLVILVMETYISNKITRKSAVALPK